LLGDDGDNDQQAAAIRKAREMGLETKTEKFPFYTKRNWRNAASNIDRALHSDSDLRNIFP
jgi:hypothetical protein